MKHGIGVVVGAAWAMLAADAWAAATAPGTTPVLVPVADAAEPLAPAAAAPEVRVLPVEHRVDLEWFARRALARHPALAVAQAARDEALAARSEAAAAQWPSLQLTATATRFEEPSLVTPFHGFTPGTLPAFDRNVFTANLAARYSLFDGGARRARVRRASAAGDAAAVGRRIALQATLEDCVRGYLAVLLRRDVLRAHDRRRAALDAEVDRATLLFEGGRVARVDVLRAEAARARAEAERVHAAAALEAAERELARLAGTTPDSAQAGLLLGVALADTALPERQGFRQAALAASPLVARARSDADAARAGAAVARSARWPGVQLFGNYNGWSDDDGHDALEWNAGAQLAVPLFTGGATRASIHRAQAALRRAEAALHQSQLDVEAQLDAAWTALVEAHARSRSLATAVARSEEVVRVEGLALGEGSGTQTDYLAAEAELLAVRAALAEARNAAIAARVALARATGELDLDWLTSNIELAW